MRVEKQLQFVDTKKEKTKEEREKREEELKTDLMISVFPLVDDMEAGKKNEAKDLTWEKILKIKKEFLERVLSEKEIDRIIKMRIESPGGKLKEASSKLRPEFESDQESGGSFTNKE